MKNPMFYFAHETELGADAAQLKLMLLVTCDLCGDPWGGLMTPAVAGVESLPGRCLKWDARRYEAAFQELLKSNDVVWEEFGEARGYRLAGLERFKERLVEVGREIKLEKKRIQRLVKKGVAI